MRGNTCDASEAGGAKRNRTHSRCDEAAWPVLQPVRPEQWCHDPIELDGARAVAASSLMRSLHTRTSERRKDEKIRSVEEKGVLM
ncbi:hypothetical protein CSA56_15020 [candidate division KSB3 bacterium]|uniref:Uncharacterized protein n=1 Tax=candidate division KSB3 bacterium TaxID=2044937 RepID=A0A2G6KA17_9BACT|nr:MAG: hypothetical protein CSA56_15020 [candidate division KSB3 bacterium]